MRWLLRYRPRRLLGKLLVAVVGIVVLYLVALGATYWRMRTALATCKAALIELDGSVDPQVNDADNMAIPLMAAGELGDAAYNAAFEKIEQVEGSGAIFRSPALPKLVYDALTADAEYERLICDAVARERHRSLPDFAFPTPFAYMTSWRGLARSETCIARHLQAIGKHAESAERMLRALTLASRAFDNLHSTSMLQTVEACTGMFLFRLQELCRQTRLADETLSRLDRALAELENTPVQFGAAIRREALAGIANYRKFTPSLFPRCFPPAVYNDQFHMLNPTNRSADRLGISLVQFEREFDDLKFRKDSRHTAGDQWLRPVSFAFVHGTYFAECTLARLLAHVRCLRVIAAMQRVKDDSGLLFQLGIPLEATLDPFDDRPLRTKRLPEGWIVYAVGPDFKDDGGRVYFEGEPYDVGFGPERRADAADKSK